MFRIVGQVFDFVGIVFKVVQFVPLPVEVGVDRSLSVQVTLPLQHRLPGGGGVQIGGEGIGQLVREVHDVLVAAIDQ